MLTECFSWNGPCPLHPGLPLWCRCVSRLRILSCSDPDDDAVADAQGQTNGAGLRGEQLLEA